MISSGFPILLGAARLSLALFRTSAHVFGALSMLLPCVRDGFIFTTQVVNLSLPGCVWLGLHIARCIALVSPLIFSSTVASHPRILVHSANSAAPLTAPAMMIPLMTSIIPLLPLKVALPLRSIHLNLGRDGVTTDITILVPTANTVTFPLRHGRPSHTSRASHPATIAAHAPSRPTSRNVRCVIVTLITTPSQVCLSSLIVGSLTRHFGHVQSFGRHVDRAD
mmetsp:Transcript_3818/g.6753  ORF Transcript_3818/g.6753 Transcript_3818/m.6753 type:complete len:223 (+) Transcript_3818:627-1295(+)